MMTQRETKGACEAIVDIYIAKYINSSRTCYTLSLRSQTFKIKRKKNMSLNLTDHPKPNL